MPTLDAQDIPPELHRRLKARALRNRRSLNREAIECLRAATGAARSTRRPCSRERERSGAVSGRLTQAELERWKAGRPAVIVVDTNVIAYLWIPGVSTPAAGAPLCEDLRMVRAACSGGSELRSVVVEHVRHRSHGARTRRSGSSRLRQEQLARREFEVASERVLQAGVGVALLVLRLRGSSRSRGELGISLTRTTGGSARFPDVGARSQQC